MIYQNKTKEVLIKELRKLQQKYNSLRTSYEKDIINLKRSEEELRKSEEKWRKLVTTIPDYIALHDLNGRYLFLNHCAEGFSEKDVTDKSLYDFISEDSKEEYRRYFNECIHAKQTQQFVYTALGNNRTFRTYENYLVPIIEKDQIISILTIAKDVTERKLAEEALHQEKENFRHSLDDSPLGVRIASADGNTIYANKTILGFYGYDNLGELQKTPLKDRYTPESYAQAQKRKHQRKLGDFSATEYEISIIRKNGEIRHLQVYRKEVLWDGVSQSQVIYKDITVRKQVKAALRDSEARFRNLFENSLMGIAVTDPDGHLVQINQSYARMYGYKNPEEMLAEVSNVRRLYSNPEDRKEVLQLLRKNGFVGVRKVEVVRRDGSRFPVLVSANEIRDADGKLIYNQATQLDITERRQAEEELRNSKELLEKLNQHLLEVRENERAVISREIHDQLGQSMTALKLDLNRMHIYLDNNPEAVAKLKGMIGLVSDTIKDVQRISTDLRPGILDELGLVSAIEWYCDEFEKRTGIKCNLKLDNSDYSNTQINLTFFRVLQETLTNVIRHAKASSVSIKLHLLNKGATMTVKDDGIGIPEEKISSIKSFGLNSMRERVKQFNGAIDISSKKEHGTKLVIFIPS